MGRTADTTPAAPSPYESSLALSSPSFPTDDADSWGLHSQRHLLLHTLSHAASPEPRSDILTGLRRLLPTLPSWRIIVHVGTDDAALKQSEVTKSDFTDMLRFLNRSGGSVLISGPIPTLGRGSEGFSRLLGLHSWLQSACKNFNILHIDNFNLFWDRWSHFKPGGFNPK